MTEKKFYLRGKDSRVILLYRLCGGIDYVCVDSLRIITQRGEVYGGYFSRASGLLLRCETCH